MTSNHKDPKSYLNSLVSKRGASGPYGVYLTNLTVVAEAEVDYGYNVNFRRCGPTTPPIGTSVTDWANILVALRYDNPQLPLTISTQDVLSLVENQAMYQFLPEGGSISLNVFLPFLDTLLFENFVVTTQDMLTFAANFSGKIPTHIRFCIGYANSGWNDLAEEGEVEERELSY